MTTTVTKESLAARIAELESGARSLKEDYTLAAYKMLLATMVAEPVAVTDDELNAALQLHRLKVDGHSQLSDAFRAGFRYARRTTPQPAPAGQPVMFIDGDISSEDADKLAKVIREFNEEDERPLAKMARIIRENPHPTNECDMPKVQPAPVVPDGIELVANTLEHIGNFADAAIIRQLAANQQQDAQQNIPEIIPESCTWTFSNYDDHWSGTCGVEWIFPDGGPEENGVKFCPKCGKSVAVSATEGTEE